MNKYFFLTITVFAFLITGCASMGIGDSDTSDIKVSAKTDKKANMSGYTSYTWIAAGAVLNDPEAQWKPPGFKAGETIRNLIDDEMKEKGYLLKGEGADLGVAFFIGLDMKAREFKTNPESNQKEMQDVAKGALVVALVDTRTGFIVWMGEAVGEAQKEGDGGNTFSDEKVRKRLDYAISKMFDLM